MKNNHIKIDNKNYRKHNDENKNLIAQSLRDLGFGRSILIDNDNTIIAGNATFVEADKLGMPIKVIETDGTELVAIKRTDLQEGDLKRKQLGVIDNLATDKSEFDSELIKLDFDDLDLSSFGIAFDDLDLKIEVENLGTFEGQEQENSSKNKEVDIDNLDTQECKIVFKFDAVMYESVLQRLNTIKQDKDFSTNEAVLLELLISYESIQRKHYK
jgi:hypothetical protein